MPKPLRRAHTAAAVLVAIVAALCVPTTTHATTEPRLIVGFTDDTGIGAQREALGRSGLRARSAVPKLRASVVSVPRHRLRSVRAQLARRADVAYVEVDHVARAYGLGDAATRGVAAQWRPNDAFLSQQWALSTTGAERAWELSRGTGVTVAVLDTGVDYIHPDLAGRVDLGRDFVDRDDDPMDAQGHGTHVAGIVAAAADDGFGVAGMAPGARILAVRVLDGEGAGNYSQVANGIVHAVERGARVINLSLGGTNSSQLLRDAIDHAVARGAIVTCATGNEGAASIGYPARYESCIAVGATDIADQHAPFSNAGAGIDLTAPGSQILSTTTGASHEAWDGTSMAAPYVSGVAALVLSQGLGRRDALAALLGTARDLGPHGPDTRFGVGRIDAAAAVEAGARVPRRATDGAAPAVSAVTVLPVRRATSTTWKQRWKLRSRTGFRRVGTTDYRGSFAYARTRLRGRTRTVSTFRYRGGIVYRRVVVHVKVRTAVRRTTLLLPVRVDASDDVGVDRVAVEVDGRTRGIDWSPADGWVVEVPCQGGTKSITARAFDVADNAGHAVLRQRITC